MQEDNSGLVSVVLNCQPLSEGEMAQVEEECQRQIKVCALTPAAQGAPRKAGALQVLLSKRK